MTFHATPQVGEDLYALLKRLFPICRSLSGDGVRKTFGILREYLPNLMLHEVPSGQPCFDWHVPREWNIHDAYILDPSGHKIVDFKNCNLHVVGYSTPIHSEVSLKELQEHLYSLPELPDAIPYVTSYYQERWGFCISDRQRQALKDGTYCVKIDSELKDGSLTYGEIYIPGQSAQEIFLSTYICHPSMANNELSGPCVATFLARWIASLPSRRYSYRIVFVPETIGSILYTSLHLEKLKKNVCAGFILTCLGDEGTYSYLPTRAGNTLSDQVAQHILKHLYPSYKRYSFLDRGSDERQYCSPGVDLPMATIMRSKYGTYKEYHSSLDNLDFVTPKGLEGGFIALKCAIEALEVNCFPTTTVLCEPHLGKRGLYPTLSTKASGKSVAKLMHLLAYADGRHSLLDIAEIIDAPIWELYPLCKLLEEKSLITLKFHEIKLA